MHLLESQTINTTICHCVVGHHTGLHTFKTALWVVSLVAHLRVSFDPGAFACLRHDLVLTVPILDSTTAVSERMTKAEALEEDS